MLCFGGLWERERSFGKEKKKEELIEKIERFRWQRFCLKKKNYLKTKILLIGRLKNCI